MKFSQFTHVQAKINATERGLNSTYSTYATNENLVVWENSGTGVHKELSSILADHLAPRPRVQMRGDGGGGGGFVVLANEYSCVRCTSCGKKPK
jgi:hypothetical protein